MTACNLLLRLKILYGDKWHIGITGVASSTDTLVKGLSKLKTSLVTFLIALVLGGLLTALVQMSLTNAAIKLEQGEPVKLSKQSLNTLIMLSTILVVAFYYSAYRGYKDTCRWLEPMCIYKKAMLLGIPLAIIQTIVLIYFTSKTADIILEASSKNYYSIPTMLEEVSKYKDKLLITAIAAGILSALLYYFYYKGFEEIGEVLGVPQMATWARIGIGAAILSVIAIILELLKPVATILTIVAIVQIYRHIEPAIIKARVIERKKLHRHY